MTKQKLFKSLVTICALTLAGFFASPDAGAAKHQQGKRFFWVYNCPGGEFTYFEYKSSRNADDARKHCERHARHEKKYKNVDCPNCAQVTTADGKIPEPEADSATKK